MSLINCPNEILYQIIDHLDSLQDFESLRDAHIGRFGHPLNYSIRRTLIQQDEYSMRALFWGAATQDEDLVRLVLEKGSSGIAVRVDALCSDKEIDDYRETKEEILEQAPQYLTLGKKQSPKIIRTVLQSGPNLFIAPCSRVLPPENGQILLEESALTNAIKNDSLSRLRLLLRLGADPNVKNSYGLTAFDAVMAHRPLFQEEMLKLLHTQEADLYFRGRSNEDLDPTFIGIGGNTLIHLAAICSDSVNMVKTVLSTGVNINVRNTKQETALHLAFSHDSAPPELIKVLIENGADCSSTPIQMTDSYEWTPRIKAKVVVFVENVGDDYRGDDGDTLLHIALRSFMAVDDVRRLLERGLDVDAWSAELRTTLRVAARYGDDETVQLLLENGVL